eukprot:gene3335-7283_t
MKHNADYLRRAIAAVEKECTQEAGGEMIFDGSKWVYPDGTSVAP